jgi:hypothetical protein
MGESKETPLARYEPEISRIRQFLKMLLRFLEVTHRKVETKMEVQFGYLTRVVAGSIDLKLGHILAICEVAEIDPAELFRILYPKVPKSPTSAARRLQDFLSSLSEVTPVSSSTEAQPWIAEARPPSSQDPLQPFDAALPALPPSWLPEAIDPWRIHTLQKELSDQVNRVVRRWIENLAQEVRSDSDRASEDLLALQSPDN